MDPQLKKERELVASFLDNALLLAPMAVSAENQADMRALLRQWGNGTIHGIAPDKVIPPETGRDSMPRIHRPLDSNPPGYACY